MEKDGRRRKKINGVKTPQDSEQNDLQAIQRFGVVLVHPGRTGIAVSKRVSIPNSMCVLVYTQHVKVQSCFSH